MPDNLPSKPGVYWARESGFNWFNLIVYIYGDAPFLSLDIWKIGTSEVIEDADIECIKEFGEMIAEEPPEVDGLREDIQP